MKPRTQAPVILERRTRPERYLTLLRVRRLCQRPAGAQDWPDGLGWVSLPDVQREAGAQHGARKQELEARGHKIKNVMKRQPNGEIWSWYRLEHDAELDKIPTAAAEVAIQVGLPLTGESRPWSDPEEDDARR